MTPDLLPCAHCGSPAKFGECVDTENFGGEFIECTNLQCGMSTCIMFPSMCSVKEDLAERWNTRTSPPSDRTDGEPWTPEELQELARVEAQTKEEALSELEASGVDLENFKKRVHQIVEAGVAKHSTYCKITRSDGSVHMLPDPTKLDNVEWQLRYGKPDSVRWEAASVVSAYRVFYSLPYKSRLEVMGLVLRASQASLTAAENEGRVGA